MTPEAKAYLRKARESLASAEADVQARRFNSATSRAYYAVFQAAVAALIENGIKPRGDSWDHRFVISEFSGRLIRRRKVVRARLTGILDVLLQRRLRADYRPAGVGGSDARNSVVNARAFLQEVGKKLKG